MRPVRRRQALERLHVRVTEFCHLGIIFWFQPEILVKYAPKLLVGRPGLDPCTLGLKGTCELLLCVGLVAYVFSFQVNVSFLVSLVSWCCRNMRPKMRPVRTVAVDPAAALRPPRRGAILKEHCLYFFQRGSLD